MTVVVDVKSLEEEEGVLHPEVVEVRLRAAGEHTRRL